MTLYDLEQSCLSLVDTRVWIVLPTHAHVESKLKPILSNVHVCHLHIRQIDLDVQSNVGQGREVELAIFRATDDQYFFDRQQHVLDTGRQIVERLQHIDHGDDEVHFGNATKHG